MEEVCDAYGSGEGWMRGLRGWRRYVMARDVRRASSHVGWRWGVSSGKEAARLGKGREGQRRAVKGGEGR